MTTVYYCAYDDESGNRYRLTLDASYATYDLTDEDDQADIAVECAADWHSNHDGWEANWPRVFVLYAGKESPALARLEVDRESVPSFSATHVPGEQEDAK